MLMEAKAYDPIDTVQAAQPSRESRALARLTHFVSCLTTYSDLDDCLSQLALLVARIFEADTCAILLRRAADAEDQEPQLLSNHAREAKSAVAEQLEQARTAAAQVLASDRPELVQIASSAHRASPAMAAPIRIDGAVVGALCIVGPRRRRRYAAQDLHLLDIVARYVDRLVEVIQLRCLLNSRFAQLALLHEGGVPESAALAAASRSPDALAKLVARSFYREMAKAGFCSRQIINAAAEIISQITNDLDQRGSNRQPAQLPARAK